MAAKKVQGVTWRHTTVLVRADIFEGAVQQGLDISDTCNKALAAVLGIDYVQQRLDDGALPNPVIVAKDGGIPAPVPPLPASPAAARPPVINADDPAAAGVIARARRQTVPRPVPITGPEDSQLMGVPPAEHSTPAPKAAKAKKSSPKNAGNGHGIKMFIAEKILRDDAADAKVPKEELYRIFSRWCREQKISNVPEAKTFAASLKTRFAFKECTETGLPCWSGVKLR